MFVVQKASVPYNEMSVIIQENLYIWCLYLKKNLSILTIVTQEESECCGVCNLKKNVI